MQDDFTEQQLLAQNIRAVRRVMWSEVFLGIFGRMGIIDLTFTQFAALLFLDARGEAQIKDLASMLARSLGATSRLVDGLVQRELVERREDPADRRSRRVSLSQAGHDLLSSIEQARVDAQINAMEALSPEERAIVMDGMRLMALAVARRPADEHTHGEGSEDERGAGAEPER